MADLFAEIDMFRCVDSDDIIDKYLTTPMDSDTDPIKFWSAHLDKPETKVTAQGAFAQI